MQAGDLPAMQAALRKISENMPELAGDAANLAEVLAGQFTGAFLGNDAEDVANAGFNPTQPRLRGKWSGEGDGGGKSSDDSIRDAYRYAAKRATPRPALNPTEWASRVGTKVKLTGGETAEIGSYNTVNHQLTAYVKDGQGNAHPVYLGADDIAGAGSRSGQGSVAEINKGRAAAERILATHQDQISAITHPEIGPIDFRWGNSKGGIQHIADKHGRETVLQLPQMIMDGKVRRAVKRVYVEAEHYTVMFATDHFNSPSNHWVLTGYMHHEKQAGETGAG